MIGSVTALMIVKNSVRSRRSLRASSARLPRPRTWSIFCPRTVTTQWMSDVTDGARSSSSPEAVSSVSVTPLPRMPSGIAMNGPRPSGVAGNCAAEPFGLCALKLIGAGDCSAAISGS